MLQATKVGSEFLVNTQTASFQTLPTVTGLANGGFVVSWSDLSGTLGDSDSRSVKAQVYSATGARVGSEFLVNTETASYPQNPNFSQQTPTITGLANGNFVVSWEDYSGTLGDADGGSIKAQVFSAAGAKVGGEFLVNTPTGRQFDPAITALANGNFVVTWSDFGGTSSDTSQTGVKAQVFDASGAKVGGEFLVNTQTESDQQQSTVTGLANGGFVVSWSDYSRTLGDADSGSVKAQVFSASGARVGGEFLVNSNTAGVQYQPSIAGLANGGFVVTWEDTMPTAGGSNGIKAQVFSASGVRVGGEFAVNTQTENSQMTPTVAALADGGFVITWYDFSGTLGDASEASVKAQAFAADGTRVGSEFLVNTQTSGSQYQPSITGLANGGFVVGWTDFSGTLGDADNASIKAQIFSVVDAANVLETLGQTVTKTVAEFDAYDRIVTFDQPGSLGDPVSLVLSDGGALDIAASLEGARGAVVKASAFGNTITTGSKNDTLISGAGNDSFFGGAGDDIYVLGNTGDTVTELFNQGTDTVRTGLSYTLGDNVENLELLYSGRAYGTGNALANTITGNGSDNVLYGLAGNDILIGGGGNDTLYGGSGADAMAGGTGSDIYTVDDAGDTVTELFGEGIDKVRSGISFTLSDNVENLELLYGGQSWGLGNSLDNVLFGNVANNVLKGFAGNDTLIGGQGADAMTGGTGDDIYYVDNAGDTVTELGNEGIDTVRSGISYTLSANVENLTLLYAGQAWGSGNELGNAITGNTGDNVLRGMAGNDTLIGGLGADAFVFNTPLNAGTNVDAITDFSISQGDVFWLDDAAFAALTPGSLQAGDFVAGTAASNAAQNVIYDSATGSLFYDADGLGGIAQVKFASVTPGTALAASQFVVI